MAISTKRIFKKSMSWAGLFFFALACYMIYRQLHNYEFGQITQALADIPVGNLLLACAASFFGYVALSLYDWLSLKYIGKKLSAWKWILAGFIGFSISNNAGHAIISGGTFRYRVYTRWRLRANEIVKLVTFSGFTYLWACLALVILGYCLTPSHAFGDGGAVSHTLTLITVIAAVLGLLGYFGAILFYKKPIVIKGVKFPMPSLKMGLAQVIIGGADILLASLVLYFVLIPFMPIHFSVFIGVFLIAQVLGVFSQVPGGLGVFEGLFVYIIPGDYNKVYILGALIAYRIIYYLLPLIISGIVLLIYENYLGRQFRKRRLKLS